MAVQKLTKINLPNNMIVKLQLYPVIAEPCGVDKFYDFCYVHFFFVFEVCFVCFGGTG